MTMTTAPETLEIRGDDDARVVAYRWAPSGEARAVVQLTHGMGEHALRYADLAAVLNAEGYAVYAQDHRGHGATAASEAAQGQIGADGWTGLVNDIGALRRLATSEHPGLPLVLLGHSMGSFAVQQYLPEHATGLAGVVLTGTAAIDLLEPAMNLDVPMDLSSFNAPFDNAPFEPARTDYDWLSRDDAQVDAYVADSRCGFGLDVEASKAMFAGAAPLADPERMKAVPSDLPIYVAVGSMDPVNGQLVLAQALVARYLQAGVKDVTFKVYAEARHEVFNETNRDEVVADLVAWLASRLR
jgi:alpha-beta hydrolase superfamily lysophospholipase